MLLNQFPFLLCLPHRIVGESKGLVFKFVGCKEPKKLCFFVKQHELLINVFSSYKTRTILLAGNMVILYKWNSLHLKR